MRKYGAIKRELEYLRDTREEEATPQNASFEAITAELLLDCREILIHLRDGSDEDIWGDDLLDLLDGEEEDDGPETILPPPGVHGI